jgi:CO dehydrogenase nickel-insertion accessory protein CooC1
MAVASWMASSSSDENLATDVDEDASLVSDLGVDTREGGLDDSLWGRGL